MFAPGIVRQKSRAAVLRKRAAVRNRPLVDLNPFRTMRHDISRRRQDDFSEATYSAWAEAGTQVSAFAGKLRRLTWKANQDDRATHGCTGRGFVNPQRKTLRHVQPEPAEYDDAGSDHEQRDQAEEPLAIPGQPSHAEIT